MTPQRKIIHVDMDAFYASIEVRDDPTLRGRPIAVGGRASARGVIATCSYEARAFGVHSAMSSARAMRLCPALLIVPPRFAAYQTASRAIRAIFARYTDRIEPLSLDEAYLDVSGSAHFDGSATRIATAIQAAVADELGLSCSAGVAPNKMLAKVASDWKKPSGLTVIRPQDIDAFVRDLPVGKIHGIGPKGRARLEALCVKTAGQMQALSVAQLEAQFGSWGARLHQLCRGDDDREVVTEWEPRQVSIERTFERDFVDLDAALQTIEAMAAQLRERIASKDLAARIRGHSAKLRFSDFHTASADARGRHVPTTDDLLNLLLCLHVARPGPIRLIGLGVRLDPPRGGGRQLDLFDDVPAPASGDGTDVDLD